LNEAGVRKRLAAILAADAVGYSRLMALDEDATVIALDAARTVFRSQIALHQGRLVDTAGDSVLAVFETATGALSAALAIQKTLHSSTEATPEDRRMLFRVGLHLGDVIEKPDGTVYGDGINIAARVQSLAEPGAIMASDALQSAVRSRVAAVFEDQGEHELKNIALPVRVFRVSPEGGAQTLHLGTRSGLHALPRERTRFIGRKSVLEECAQLLRGARLLTLTGIGGSGKTRLALKLAENLPTNFADGVWFVDLAPLQEGQRLTLTVASVLGLRDDTGKPLIDVVTAHLANRRALIVLDNCEHVIQAATEVADSLLAKCGRLSIIATSRENLGLAEEQIYAVRPMGLPTGSDLASVQSADAVNLFIDRARLVDPGFNVTLANAATVGEICRRLDGIPLAIELAAARVKMLSVEEIHAKLGDRFRLLVGSNRALPRHQTLQAAIQWSYDQLAPAEQALLCKLSVFAGGWTLAAATYMAGGADHIEVLDQLTRIADKSLIASGREGEETRYSMLETIRQYAQQKLDESGVGDVARSRHLAFCLTLPISPETSAREELDWCAQIDKDFENLLAAHRWCDSSPELAEAGLRLVAPLFNYYRQRGLARLGFRLCTEAISRPAAQPATRLRYQALRTQGHLAFELGHYEGGQTAAVEALAIARQLDDANLISDTLIMLVSFNTVRGQLSVAEELLSELMPIATKLDRGTLIAAHHHMGELRRNQGNLDAAKALYEEVLRLCHGRESRSEKFWVLVELGTLALVALAQDDATAARARLREAMAIEGQRAVYQLQMRREVIPFLAAVMAAHREWALSARLHGYAQSVVEDGGKTLEPVDAAVIDPLIARTRGALGDAQFAIEEAAGRKFTLEQAIALAETWLNPPTANA
jgi:predicted ATPase/class 3 adenylate cyclase